ncbi:MAG TPA: EAL domain-containing protein [Solirubrobacteraceae bacterium]|nr:EAL domain-containing protein [Solirubrobacteraceae bacterium]
MSGAREAAGGRPQHSLWTALAAILIAAGIAVSVLGSRLVAGNDRQRARATFDAAAADVASTLTQALEHEEDLAIGARAFVIGNPYASQAAFLDWTRAVEALPRYPELQGAGLVVEVPAAQLPAFEARERADPTSPLPGGSFQVLPPGPRPFYCLLALSLTRTVTPADKVPAGFDYCALPTSLRSAFLTARDSGQNAYLPYKSGAADVLVVETPVYRGGVVPRTVAARRRAFLGDFGTTVIPRIVLRTALRGHPHMALEFRHGTSSSVAFRAGAAAPGARSATRDVHYGWTMRASEAVYTGGMLSDSKALLLLGGGIVLSAMLGLLLFVLGTGRSRARAMVRRKTQELSHQALHDALTDLPNRALALDRAERMLARARREQSIVPAALFVDVDRFKRVNDTYGHAAGDQLLRTVAQRLRGAVRDQDTVGRLGGDEFVVLLESATREIPPDAIAERVIEAMREPVVLDDGATAFTCSVSIGIAIGMRASADELLRDADLALYAAKAEGKDRAVLFEASMQSSSAEHLQLEAELAEAVENQQLFLVYQPIFDLNTRKMVSVEALVRWQHPERGVVAPDDFIPLAEETGHIGAIGRWVLDEACRQAAEWKAKGHLIGMAVNVSAHQLDEDGLVHDVRRALGESGIAPSSLTLEITETALMHDVLSASERLQAVKALGVRIAIDDFGTGFSSLAYLRQFSADALKIDRSFIAAINDSRDSAAIVHTLVALGKALHIETLAEGIEGLDQLELLQHEQCDQGQGFLFARPLTPEALERFLESESRDSAASAVTP